MSSTSLPLATVEQAQQLGLRIDEFDKIQEILGRTPNFTELSIYSVMWSEHCSYKNSIAWLKTLPKKGEKMLAEAGEENAGLIDIGDGLAVCFKIESHNHPSAIEPYQGAATGVGGINRDIFTMGARPIAQLNSLRFGKLSEEKTKWLLKGVVKGIGDYGNAFGIPTVGGEVYFDECYHVNPLVNAMSVGIAKVGKTASATSYGVGNPVYIIGSATGKDGIHGASFASKDITEDSAKDLPSVQVGDPFAEKLLLEATLEIIETGATIGIQDMGAAGITCSTSEMSAKGEHGMIIYLDKVPMRQKGMVPFEILLSESQERMLMVITKGRESEVENILRKWDISYAEIGEVTKGDRLIYYFNNELVADVPAQSLVLGGGAPVYHREYSTPKYFDEIAKFNASDIEIPSDLKAVGGYLLKHPNIASKRWVYNQYDSMVGTITQTTNQPSDAGVVKVRGTNKSLAMSVDCNSRYVFANPEIGGMIAVAESARNVVCAGGEPAAITNCLNFGNPYNPEVYYQFVHAIKGISAACLKLNTPVTGGNVSFYNQSSDNDAVFPTPTIGMLGIIDGGRNHTPLAFQQEGDIVILIGKTQDDIGSSHYLAHYHKIKFSPAPYFNLDEEFEIQKVVLKSIQQDLVVSAHDVSEGGLFVTLCESAFVNNLGFNITLLDEFRMDAALFGESQSRIVLSVSPTKLEDIKQQLNKVPFTIIGKVSGKNAIINGADFGVIAELNDSHQTAIEIEILK
ncbi:MAG: phosphoribosylformylglycinamidine synthase subunit PurL [Bacteroidetes bacterium]|nr:phosphoribosylformylglycinamidine synthase subunit PurL [Bacteroidota bacterium]